MEVSLSIAQQLDLGSAKAVIYKFKSIVDTLVIDVILIIAQ